MSRLRCPVRPLTLMVLLFCLSVSACSGSKNADLPKTFAVKGKVVYQEDGQPLVDGSLQLEPIDSSPGSIAHVGTTQADGRFEISTLKDNTKVPGTPEGSYRIRITPRMGADQKDNSVVLPGPYKVEPRDENTFNRSLPGKAPAP